MDWKDATAPSLDDIEILAREAFAGLPAEFRALTGEIVFMVQDFPDDDVIEDMELESPFDILGLFQGPDLASREGASASHTPTMIFLYRRPILDYWSEHDEPLGHIVRHVLIHEIGHHFGLSDDDMESIEERA
ncbi:MAG TPA: metallopeptidase family protein [Micropepsaceae bacterium]|jgi:predicted Zn-dependent protease with MMP-like domain|nr:metallopeptidase family protein [Micropepsaceae bacterium]